MLTTTISVSRRIVPFSSGSCLGKLECVKANISEIVKIIVIIIVPQCNLNTSTLLAFMRFYLRVLADGNKIILHLNQKCYSEKSFRGKTYCIWHKQQLTVKLIILFVNPIYIKTGF